jgi:hypothetical protein
VGRSSENDYQSNFFNIDSRLDLNNKLTTVETGYGFSSDTVWAIDHCPPHCLNSNSSSSNSLDNITPNNPSSANSITAQTQTLKGHTIDRMLAVISQRIKVF